MPVGNCFSRSRIAPNTSSEGPPLPTAAMSTSSRSTPSLSVACKGTRIRAGVNNSDRRTVLAQWLAERGEPAYRARQVLPRLWERPVGSWDEATELPAALRRALTEALPLRRLALSARQVSQDGTEKYLWDLGDGEAVESVLIPEGKRRTLCISSQVGCALGCVFCATGRMGFRRNLSVAEIAAQVREVILLDPLLAPTNVVFMGMGEPLLNW